MFSSSMAWKRKGSKVSPAQEMTVPKSVDLDMKDLDNQSTEEYLTKIIGNHAIDSPLTEKIRQIISFSKRNRRQSLNLTMNMILANAALGLTNDLVIFLNSDGTLLSTNRSLDLILGSKEISGHVSTWLGENQGTLLKDVIDVLSSGMSLSGRADSVNPDNGSVIPFAYDITAVNECGSLNSASTVSDIVAVVVLLKVRQDSLTSSNGLISLASTLLKSATTKEPDNKVKLANLASMLDNLSLMDALSEGFDSVYAAEGGQDLSALMGCGALQLVGDIDDWDFDVMQLRDKAHLRGLLGMIFSRCFNLAELKVEARVLATFIMSVQEAYRDNPFHNFYHVVTVTHFLMLLNKATGADDKISQMVLFATMVSAVVHDVDHPGHNNAFEINAGSELSLTYSEKSVLENHHISTTFRLMRRKGSNVFEGMDTGEVKKLKKIIMSNIIATDMERHFVLVEKVKNIPIQEIVSDTGSIAAVPSKWDFSSEHDAAFYCRIMLHAADLSNPVRPYKMSEFWSRCINAEFNNQVKKEKSLGLPFMEFMVVETEKQLCKGEIGFASFVVAPMWKAIAVIFPMLGHLETQLYANVNVWKGRLAKVEESSINL